VRRLREFHATRVPQPYYDQSLSNLSDPIVRGSNYFPSHRKSKLAKFPDKAIENRTVTHRSQVWDILQQESSRLKFADQPNKLVDQVCPMVFPTKTLANDRKWLAWRTANYEIDARQARCFKEVFPRSSA